MKLVITADKIAEANTPRRTFVVQVEATDLSYRELANVILDLATSVEARADAEDRLVDLRKRVEARAADLTTTTRMLLPEFANVRLHADGKDVGYAMLRVEQPKPKRRPARFPTLTRSTVIEDDYDSYPALTGSAVIEGDSYDDEESDGYDEDEDVQFLRNSTWWRGTIIDRTNFNTYLVEDDHGRKWEVPLDRIQPWGTDDDDDESDESPW